jgi:hypothetical protein
LTVVCAPLIEKLMTFTPSLTAVSMAATESVSQQEFWLPLPSGALALS